MKHSMVVLVFVTAILLSGCQPAVSAPTPYPTLVVSPEGTIGIQSPTNGAVVSGLTEFVWVDWKPLGRVGNKDGEDYFEMYKVVVRSTEDWGSEYFDYTFDRHLHPDQSFFSRCGGKRCGGKVFVLEVTRVRARAFVGGWQVVEEEYTSKHLFVWKDVWKE